MTISTQASTIRATGFLLLAAVSLAFTSLLSVPAHAADEPSSTPNNKSGNVGLIDHVPVEVRIQDVTVANGLTTVNFTIHDTRTTGDRQLIGYSLDIDRLGVPLGDGTERNEKPGAANAFRPTGLTLIDPNTAKIYQVAHTAEGKCLCSEENTYGATLDPGQTKIRHATFAALPKETKTVTITSVVGGTFIDVPVKHLDSPEPPQSGWAPQGANKEAIKNPIYAPVVDSIFVSGEKDNAAKTSVAPDVVVTTLSGDVNFEVDSDQLTPRAKEILDKLAGEWSKKAPSEVTVTGHTDNVADDNHNMDLSKRRAKTVGDYLAGKVRGLKVQTDGKGETAPIADNNKDEGKAANRRVEIRAKE
ncbi:MAG: OmpA family protein [Actinomycetaceae bacterium]|nr:OmpA family protein [Actinomycetaceae bacterium]